MAEQHYKVALLFNANKVYDRGVIEGIGQYIQASQCTQEIAEMCGYPSLQYFYAVFKKELNQTPKEFRGIYF